MRCCGTTWPCPSDQEITDDALRASIAVYNENLRAVQRAYADLGTSRQAPTSEVDLLMRAGWGAAGGSTPR